MTTYSSILAWRIPGTEEPGRLQFMGSQRVGHGWETFAFFHFLNNAQISVAEYDKSLFIPLTLSTVVTEYQESKLPWSSGFPIAIWGFLQYHNNMDRRDFKNPMWALHCLHLEVTHFFYSHDTSQKAHLILLNCKRTRRESVVFHEPGGKEI